jgi:hypothetical protein
MATNVPVQWQRTAVTNILSTDFDSKAAGTHTIASAIDNSAGSYMYLYLQLILGSLNPGANTNLTIRLYSSYDDTNYPDLTIGNENWSGTRIIPSGSGIKTPCAWDRIVLGPFKYKATITHAMSVSTASSGNSLFGWLYRENSVMP